MNKHWFYMPLAAAVAAVVCAAAWTTAAAVRTLATSLNAVVTHADSTLASVDSALKGKHANGDDGILFGASMLVKNADGAANALKQTAQTVNKVTKANQPSTAKVSDASLAAIRAGQDSLVKLGRTIDALNDTVMDVRTVTLPKVNAGVDSLNAVVAGLRPVEDNAAAMLASGNEVTQDLKGTVAAVNVTLGDPDITASIKNTAAFSLNMASFSKHLDTSMSYVETDLSPKHIPLWQVLAEGALGNVIGIPFKRISQTVSITGTPTVLTK